MSKIVAFRDKIVEAVKDIAAIREVDWYDGLFDQTDIEEWALNTPSVFIAVREAPKPMHHTTGELNLDLRCMAVVICQDRKVRDADTQIWGILESLADLVNLNKFGDVNAAPGCEVKIKRIRDPELRRDGIALGVVEWVSGFTLGTNRSELHEYIYDNGTRVEETPAQLSGRGQLFLYGVPVGSQETLDLSEDEA